MRPACAGRSAPCQRTASARRWSGCCPAPPEPERPHRRILLRVAFNAIALLSPLTGIGQYSFELATRLATSAVHEAEFFYAKPWSREVRTSPLPMAGKAFPLLRRTVPRSYELSRLVQRYYFSRRARTASFDVYHEPNFLAFPFDGATVTTVHDLSWIRFPEAHPVERVRAMNRYFEPGLRRTTLVLTDSQFVKNEVVDVFGIDPTRVLAIPLGASPVFRPHTSAETARVLGGLDLQHGQYLLAVGTLEPRKNLIAALRAYAALDERTREAFPLVLAGLKGWHADDLDRELEPLVRSGSVRLTGYVSREDLAAIVAGATALVYPSIYEGFGLPPLEAMASGVPAIVGNVASLPEVVGDAGLLVEPNDVMALRDAMRRMVEAPDERARLGALSLERAARFCWDRCAAETFAAYARAAAMAS